MLNTPLIVKRTFSDGHQETLASATSLQHMIEEIYHETRSFKQEARQFSLSNVLISTIDTHISQQYYLIKN
ncbi:hypothetical protein [Vibrio tapetis]|uniref:Uncharacterized protein n=1 Tax=Vibrio tapetis subsp. tapetis TaxID=1671868 RepID=A0A2N8ZGG2_9VIBR|nr:hypothetical protein [Vibrio tapetis]SON50986.1 protein of unknown function [Vibrio tapetis subsp. tapetis]